MGENIFFKFQVSLKDLKIHTHIFTALLEGVKIAPVTFNAFRLFVSET